PILGAVSALERAQRLHDSRNRAHTALADARWDDVPLRGAYRAAELRRFRRRASAARDLARVRGQPREAPDLRRQHRREQPARRGADRDHLPALREDRLRAAGLSARPPPARDRRERARSVVLPVRRQGKAGVTAGGGEAPGRASRPEPEIDATASAELGVTDADLASAFRPGPEDTFPPVFATARMVALMEVAASRLLAPFLG